MTTHTPPTPEPPPHIAVLGAGHTGPALAKVLTEAGYPVSIAASGDPEKIALIMSFLAPDAKPRWAADAIEEADVVILALPLHRFADLDPARFAGKIVIDTMNYWPPTDGVQALFDNPSLGSSEIVQAHLPGATIVKTLNHIGYHELDESRRPAGSPRRRSLGVAGDDPAAAALTAAILDRVGYDTVTLPTLAAGRALQPGGPVFGADLTRDRFDQEVSS
ncbi:NAD(P)-binding domain-containing protein [Streptomyces sp. NPDC048411]|uniref:NADPH-dependent F420 reductase n=1 Tax=Streptomyces sp. NPDC048411 TaxID=3157206 RepID=UPI0034548BFC